MLECFLNTNGTAYAATGAALPPCFGTWFWGLGLTPNQWEPTTTGANYVLPDHIAGLNPIKEKMNLFSGMQVFLDGKVNQNHYSGAQGQADGFGIEELERLHEEPRYHHRRTDRQEHEVSIDRGDL